MSSYFILRYISYIPCLALPSIRYVTSVIPSSATKLCILGRRRHWGSLQSGRWHQNCSKADIILCLGSSLKILKIYPCLWCMTKPPSWRLMLYIVNFQWTLKDGGALLKLHGKYDDIMQFSWTSWTWRSPSLEGGKLHLLLNGSPACGWRSCFTKAERDLGTKSHHLTQHPFQTADLAWSEPNAWKEESKKPHV